ncbi:mitochondrial acyl carrier protein [Sorochytrium milnesiophthora]
MFAFRAAAATAARNSVVARQSLQSVAPSRSTPCSSSLLHARFASSSGPAREDVESRIINLLKGFDKVDAGKVTSTAHFTNDLGLDSLDTVEVVMAIEEEFAIEIPDKEADEIHTVKQAIDYIAKRDDAF